MGTELGTLKKAGSRNTDIHLKRFWGGDNKGVCVQLTGRMENGEVGYIDLSVQDILTLIPILKKNLIDVEMNRIQNNCDKLIEENKELKKTIVKDNREVSKMLLSLESYEVATLLFYGKQEFEPVNVEEN